MNPGRRRSPSNEGAIGGAEYRRTRRTYRSRGHHRPRVLQLLATGGNGGAQESYTGLLLRLDRTRYDVRALSLSAGSAVARLRRLGVAIDVIDETDDEAATRELAAWLEREEIDLVHAHMFRAEVIGTRAAVAAATPVIMATVHSSRVRSAEDQAELARLTRHMDRLIVPSASIEGKVRAEGREGAPFAVIPNGVDLSRFAGSVPACRLRRELGITGSAFLVGVVARLEREKGHRYAVAAMPELVAAVPDAWLVLVGEGSEADALRAQIAELPAPARDRVILTGRREDVAAITADLSVALLPSLREAQGISILEAMARGVPVVASRVGGIPEVISDGVDGLLVEPRDPAAVARALIRLATSPELHDRLGAAGRRTVAERFSIDAMVRRVEALYAEELARAGIRDEGDSVAGSSRPRDRAALEVPPV